MDKTRLSAFADGELSPEEAAAVVLHLADHPQDQAFVDEVMAANAALARAFRAPLEEPVPPAILAAIRGGEPAREGKVLPFRRRVAALGGLALAASVAAALFLPQAAGFLLPSAAGPGLMPVGPVAAGSALHGHLQSLPSGQAVALGQGAELMLLATLPVTGGHCREAELLDRRAAELTLALACERGAGWTVDVALSEPLPGGAAAGYLPAGGAEIQTLDLWLDRLGAGSALSPEAEAARIAAGWRP